MEAAAAAVVAKGGREGERMEWRTVTNNGGFGEIQQQRFRRLFGIDYRGVFYCMCEVM